MYGDGGGSNGVPAMKADGKRDGRGGSRRGRRDRASETRKMSKDETENWLRVDMHHDTREGSLGKCACEAGCTWLVSLTASSLVAENYRATHHVIVILPLFSVIAVINSCFCLLDPPTI